jgi:hypothetical protein
VPVDPCEFALPVVMSLPKESRREPGRLELLPATSPFGCRRRPHLILMSGLLLEISGRTIPSPAPHFPDTACRDEFAVEAHWSKCGPRQGPSISGLRVSKRPSRVHGRADPSRQTAADGWLFYGLPATVCPLGSAL